MQEKKQNISPIKLRILQFAETLGISKREFYTHIGVSRGTLESATGITEEILTKFISTYSDAINIVWLITGEGPMLRSNELEQIEEESNVVVDMQQDINLLIISNSQLVDSNKKLLNILKRNSPLK